MSGDIPLARPCFGPEESEAVGQVLNSGWVSQGPKVEAFERGLAEFLGSQHVTAVNSGTSALMLALRELEIGSGHSVVVPAFGCAATGLPVLETGARLVFAEVDPVSFNVTWETIARALQPDTRAVIVVHMFGQVADIERIAAECQRRKLLLIEDAALAFGARRANRCAGTFGTVGCFSFHPRKILTTGEGGAVSTPDPELALRVRAARNYGAAQTAWTRSQTGDGSPRGFTRLAFNCKLTDLQAAVGLAQLQRVAWFIERRRGIAERYARDLAGCRNLALPPLPAAGQEHVFQAYVCTWRPQPLPQLAENPARVAEAANAVTRLKQKLTEARVAASDAAQFLPGLPVFGGSTREGALPIAEALSRLAFAIPIFPSMTEAQIDRVVQVVRAAAENC